MKKPNLLLLLDASASMATRRPIVVPQINAYLDEVESSKGVKNAEILTFNLADRYLERVAPIFAPRDGILVTLREKTRIDKTQRLEPDEYLVGGMTPLYDAIGRTIQAHSKDKRPLIFVTMTDGQENCSAEYTLIDINQMMEEAESERGWRFIHLGEGIQGKGQAGMLHGAKIYWDAANSGRGYAVAASYTATLAAEPHAFLPEETDVD